MMITAKMNDRLNEQIANELNASHKYLAMSYCFDGMWLKVFAARFIRQAAEERTHALKIADYIHDVGGKVAFDGLEKPRGDYPNAKAIVKAALDSELTVTAQINEIVAMTEKETDYGTRSFMQWFVSEQVEEVSSMTELLQWVTLAGDNLFPLEARLAQMMAS